MILIICLLIVLLCTIITIMRSGKPLTHIMAEVKLEAVFNMLGGRGMIEDFIMKDKNKTELPVKSGQYAIVTGGSRGIGAEIVKMLMQCDMHVIVGCRKITAGDKLKTEIREQGITTGELTSYQLDTGSVKSVVAFADKIKENYSKIHILVNNAGIMFGPYAETEDGFESQFAVNYLGHFLLTHRLMPLLKMAGSDSETNARIVNVSSIAHFAGEINFEDINMKKQYISSAAYGQSKLAQVMFTKYYQTVLNKAEIPVQVHSVHPGIVNTDLFNGTPIKTLFPWLPGLIFKNPVQGATSVVYACVSPQLEGAGGTYISNCHIRKPHKATDSLENLEKLFELSKTMVGIEEYGKP